MLVSSFLTCATSLAGATALLLVLGHRLRFASRLAGIALGAVLVVGAGELTAYLWSLPAGDVQVGEAVVFGCIVVTVVTRRAWNPVGQVFFGAFVASIGTYLTAAATYTFAAGLSPLGMVASSLLLVLEVVALVLAASFAFESCDVVCRVRWERPIQAPDPSYLPKVSLQIAAYNEPPDMLMETIASVDAIDYPNFEVVVIDNNTKDPEVWQPVEEFCRDRPRVRFVHVDPWPGYKSGALNLALTEHTSPDAEVVGVVDADYLVDPDYLRSVVGYFADPQVGFVQTPQDYRDYEGDAYLTACYDAYRYFFATSMLSRNERDSIIFAGTMGLLRRSVLEGLGGWDEWCITEDAETSLRMLRSGYSGVYVPKAFGRGIMPLTFASLKSQRFRWCFGGMQILRRHWRDLVPWSRDPDNRLTTGQRLDYLFSGLQWFNDLVNLAFTIVLLTMGAVFLTGGEVGLRPLDGAVVLLPLAIIASGLLRALWALRHRTGISRVRGLLAFANWLSLSWTVSLACVQGLLRAEGVFMRTPKAGEGHRLMSALWSARTETLVAAAVWATGAAVALTGSANAFVVALFAWQGSVYAAGPFTSWLNQHTELSTQLDRRRRTEWRRERRAALRPFYVGTAVATAAAAAVAALVLTGSGEPPRGGGNPFALPEATPGDHGPIASLLDDDEPSPADEPTTTTTPEEPTTEPDGTTTVVGPTSQPSPPSTTDTSPTTDTTSPPSSTETTAVGAP